MKRRTKGQYQIWASQKESNYSNTTDPIPTQQSSEHRLLKAQKHTRDSLAKCISAVFTIDDVTVCEELSLGADTSTT